MEQGASTPCDGRCKCHWGSASVLAASSFFFGENRSVTQLFTRRRMLQIGSAGAMGVTLANLFAAGELPSALAPRADALIIMFLNGGPSHLDMWDMKPDGPRRHSRRVQADRHRAARRPDLRAPAAAGHADAPLHAGALDAPQRQQRPRAAVYTGADRPRPRRRQPGHRRTSRPTNPRLGSVLARCVPPHADVVPHVALPYITKEGAGGPPQPGFFGGLLGQRLRSAVRAQRSQRRRLRRAGTDALRRTSIGRAIRTRGGLAATRLRAHAMRPRRRGGAGSMVALPAPGVRRLDFAASTQQAFRLDEEPDLVRESYGRNIYGQSVLLARRLIEAGTRVVTISWAPDANATWDTHGGNFKKLKNTLLPQFDAACASLLPIWPTAGCWSARWWP